MAARALNLCDGYGGFSLALAGFGVRTVARVERDSYAASVLVERMAQQRLDQCPVWDDLTTFDGAAWRGRVEIITAGFPCQPFSAAGKRTGVVDDRWLWPEIARIVADVGPEFVIVENVPQLVRHGLPEVLHDLASFGFDAEWGLLSASAVGAPHERQRFWLVAHTDRDGLALERREPEHDGDTRHDADRCHGALVEHADRLRDGGQRASLGGSVYRTEAQGSGPNVGDTEREGLQGCSVSELGLRLAPEAGRWPPCRDDHAGWSRWIAAGGPQPVLRRDADGPPNGLADALHLGGNGLVPQAAAHAIRQLLARRGWSLT